MGILKNSSKRRPQPVPPHMKTTAEWADEEKMCVAHARRLIGKLVANKQWEAKKFLVERGNGVYPTFHFGPIKKK